MVVDHQELYKHGPHPARPGFAGGRVIQFFNLYEVGGRVPGTHAEVRMLICEEGRRPLRIVDSRQ